MRIAVAGSGSMARYICDEFPKYGHEVVILSRSKKDAFENRPSITQVVTDYSVASLTAAIQDCEMLISMILSYTSEFIDVHRNLIQACQASPKCKRFIPSEYGGDLENYPDIPLFYYHTREPIRKVLREQTELEWTLVSVGWLVDFVVPKQNRYFGDIGETFAVNITDKKIDIPGTGKEVLDVTVARDLAKSLALLAEAPSWEPYTYISGEKTCWNDLANLVQQRWPGAWDVKYTGLGKILDTIQTSTDEEEILNCHYKLFVPLGAGHLDQKKVEAHRQKFFPGLQFRTTREIIDEVQKNPDVVV
ncbi:hypothetical protein FQN51_007760 [Onygenales sp. PD_10]|nr:hypothetical protein FQN51_007760 [Onygenales sp. PD_10]